MGDDMSVQSVFSNPMFGTPTNNDKNRAAVGFSQLFASMLAKQMRNAMVGDGEGPLGTGGGTSGDIYGSFFDEAMGRTLASSPAMKPLNQAIERELAGPHHLHETRTANGETVASKSHIAIAPEVTRSKTSWDFSSDSRGPLLLPPEPTAVASVLPPPPPLKG
jgi:Rod binding domain-containing protein